ncbi:MAG: DUF2264 domain-containing protein [Bryobacteraceae bacterium]
MDSSRRGFLGAAAGGAWLQTAATAQIRDRSAPSDASQDTGAADRAYWLSVAARLAEPVLSALSQGKLRATMPVEAPRGNVGDRRRYTHLEAFGRLMSGIAPWLELGAGVDKEGGGAEARQRARYADLARQSLQIATDPASPDYLNFSRGQQPLVDAAFLAQALLRAPNELWRKLDRATQSRVATALRSTRAILPGANNWLMFSATVEAALYLAGETWDSMRVDYALRQHQAWYKGDGVYGDGPAFHWDYYNSFVIQPMLLDVLETFAPGAGDWAAFRPAALARARRYAAIEERLISPEATFPWMGRSSSYRFGAFHLLAAIALRRQLPEGVSPEQVRCALTAVMRRVIEAPGTFDARGWLTVGFCGHQPAIAESYISTGSLYLCATALLPLGLDPSDPFWSGPPRPWTARKIWRGDDLPPDHALAG